ncbi:small subunit processome component 20 [Rhypophila decipiens]|uniref:Small subunit processome component 20 n=1 Tax=Rhypophila decipiens TaxID=261697 RepID=A0AAN6YDA7_9PEZI|nr:small subunit processome component 20 [Rhypophila decipiens]
MPSTSAGRIVKAQRNSKKTQTQKNHRWESFTSKVSKLHSLDPLRKVRRHDLEAEDLEATTSYLRNGLDRWAELNVSKSYADFKRQITPLTDSLAQILYHEQRIIDLLAEYIEKHEKDILEALLDLLTAFAHDLGVRFEKHYPRTMTLLVNLAAKVHDVEVIEWTFAAMAFLFKYLSRLLVPDLRPTFDMIAPLMGRGKNSPGHIARFAAEAMSFLVKKAAAPGRKEKSLAHIIHHARQDLESMAETKQFELYSQGIMTMFAEALKGASYSVHSTGPEIFAMLAQEVPEEELELPERAIWTDVCCGVLTSIIHHATPESFKVVEEKVVQDARDAKRPTLFVQFFGVMAGVRRGARISDWTALVKVLGQQLESLAAWTDKTAVVSSLSFWQRLIVNATIFWAQAPVDAVLPSLSSFNNAMTKEPLMRWYIPFCSYLSDLNKERFRGLFQKDFQKFIVSHWSEGTNEETLCVLIPHMVETGGLPESREKEGFPLPQSWQDQIVNKFVQLGNTPFPESGAFGKDPEVWRAKCLPKYSALLRVLESTAVHPSTNARIAEVLLKKLKLALRPSSSLPTDEANWIVSHGLRAYLRMCTVPGSVDISLAPLLRASAPRFCRLPAFLEALLTYQQEIRKDPKTTSPKPSEGSESPREEEDPLIKSLITNLSTPSHELRLLSLKILDLLEETPDQDSALALMMQVEELPFDLQNARSIAVHLRRLGQIYLHLAENSWLMRAVPYFLFGMMTVPLSPVWDDAVEAMKKISESKAGEEAVADIAFEWLDVPSPRWTPFNPPAGSNFKRLTDFECLNFMRLKKASGVAESVVRDSSKDMLDAFEAGQAMVELRTDRARAKALQALTALPALAEKRSRRLVPHLLSFYEEAGTPSEDSEHDDEEESFDSMQDASWSAVDRKALVGVFAQFNNPKVLYLSEKVYAILLKLLANGDIEVQKLALKAILAWKSESIKPYRENLEYLLDEARFKNELTVLFQGDNQIQPQHRAELMPVLLRLLYGRTISKKGAASGRHGLHATRLAVIRQLNVQDMGSYLDIALGELKAIRVVDSHGTRESVFAQELLPIRKQVGLLNMLESIINELGTSVASYMEPLVNAILYSLISACRKIGSGSEEPEEDAEPIENASLYKVVRTTGLKCLCKLFQNAQSFDWTLYQEVLVKEIISPRIERLPAETTQSISATWRLLSTWSALPRAALFISFDKHIMPKMVECLGVAKGKDEVKVHALEMIKNLIHLAQAPAAESEFNELIRSEILDPNMGLMLKEISGLLRDQHDIGRDLLATAVDTVVELAPLVETSSGVQDMIEIVTFLLNQPSRKVSPKIKGSILIILKRFIQLENLKTNAELNKTVYSTLASLFGFFKDKQNRETLAEVLLVYAEQEPWAKEVAEICRELNAYQAHRLEEEDYNTRMSAFTAITKDRDTPFTIEQWMPIFHNLLFFILQDQEFGILSKNSADGLCKFVEAAQVVWPDEEKRGPFVDVLQDLLLPAIYSAAREESETVRQEILRVFGYLVAHLADVWEPVADLKVLIPDSEDTDEAFFYHVLSPAVSRQLQALRLLERANEKTELRSKHISQFFIPLLEHFIFGRPESGGDDGGLGAQAVQTVAVMTASLEWQQYRAILRRFISYMESKPDSGKRVIRLLEKEVDALRAAIGQKEEAKDAMEVDEEAGQAKSLPRRRRLAATLPDHEKLSAEIVNGFLPTLLKHIHDKDETTVSARVPAGIIIAKLITLLDDQRVAEKLPGVLTDICHILRSKAVESRDMARDTLAKMAGVLGPERFEFIVKELRGALIRGHQLHVLSFTLHSLLLVVIPAFPQGSLDYCLENVMAVIMDDIFGVAGQEKDAEEYISKMKEVKSSKSQDSMELVAKNASITHLGQLTAPLQALLSEKLDVRTARKVDELLTRITKGLLENPAAGTQKVLVFCYEVIQEVYRSQKPQEQQPRIHPRLKRYIVLKAAKKSDGAVTAKHTHKLTRFALDVLRAVLKKHDHLRTAANIAGFLPILGDSVLATEEEVKIAAFKLLTVIVKVPFKNDDSAGLYKVATKEAIKTISLSLSAGSDLAQAALKLISVVLRDRREVAIKDAAIDMLLNKLKDDLTEPLYRHVTFNFLRCVLDRKLETAVVYDTLDHVGEVMITNDDKDTRDLARGAFFQFLREYPQKRSRWEKQLKFIVANLKYDREGGRLSVMEVINLLLKKSADDFTQEVAATCFIPLVFVLANDDSEKCRLAGGELIKEIFRVADKDRMGKFLTMLRGWAGQEGNAAVMKLALHAFGLYFESRDGEGSSKDKKDAELVASKIVEVLGEEDDNDAGEEDDSWELVNTALHTAQTLVDKHPRQVLSKESGELWLRVRRCLAHSNAVVKLSATKLMSMYLADFAKSAGKDARPPIAGSYGLELDQDVVAGLVRQALGILSAPEVDDSLAQESMQIVLFLGGYLEADSSKKDEEDAEDANQDLDELPEDETPTKQQKRPDLNYLFWKLSSIIRKERQAKPETLVSKLAAMDILEAFCHRTPKEVLLPSLKTILRPLRNLTDPSIPAPFSLNEIFKTRHENLKTKAQTVMEDLQNKLGSADYTRALFAVGEDIRGRREYRSSKRKIEAIAAPEKYGADKRKKTEKKKERRKEKGREQRDARSTYLRG